MPIGQSLKMVVNSFGLTKSNRKHGEWSLRLKFCVIFETQSERKIRSESARIPCMRYMVSFCLQSDCSSGSGKALQNDQSMG
jgi:hypothetical protein